MLSFLALVFAGFIFLFYFGWEMIAAMLFAVAATVFYFLLTKDVKRESKSLQSENDKQTSEIKKLNKLIDEKNERIRQLQAQADKDFHTYEKTLFDLEKELHDKEIEHERNLELALSKQREELLESAKIECSEDYNNARAFYTKIKSKNPFFDKPTRQKYVEAFKDARLDRAFASYLTAPSKVTINAEIPSFTTKGEVYKTSLKECNCKDHHNPCKHMIGLALYYNAVYNMTDVKKILEDVVKERDKTRKLKKEIDKEQRKQQKKSK